MDFDITLLHLDKYKYPGILQPIYVSAVAQEEV